MGCGDEKLSKYLTQTFTAHCNAMICQQVTLLGDAEWPKVADAVIDAVISHVHWVYSAYILLHMSPPGLSPGAQSIGDKQRALQQGLADQEKRHILQKLTQIGGVQRYKAELRQALAGT